MLVFTLMLVMHTVLTLIKFRILAWLGRRYKIGSNFQHIHDKNNNHKASKNPENVKERKGNANYGVTIPLNSNLLNSVKLC